MIWLDIHDIHDGVFLLRIDVSTFFDNQRRKDLDQRMAEISTIILFNLSLLVTTCIFLIAASPLAWHS